MIFCAIVISLSVLGLLSYTIKVETNAKKKYRELKSEVAYLNVIHKEADLRQRGYRPAEEVLKQKGMHYFIEMNDKTWVKKYPRHKKPHGGCR
jgi:disulfide oxidoreductase YuzD